MYNEKYYTYLQDGFHIGSGGTVGRVTLVRNIYQFSNPFLTNIDLSQIGVNEGATVGDGINLQNSGVRLEVSGVQTASSTGGSGGTGSSSYKFITYPSGVPTGDVDYTVVRPMGTFVIKLLDNTSLILSILLILEGLITIRELQVQTIVLQPTRTAAEL
jgi:hypothetical protein